MGSYGLALGGLEAPGGIGTILLVSPWFLFAELRYGAILPNSASAKIGQTRIMPVCGQCSFLRMLWSTAIAGIHPAVIAILVAALALGIWVVLRFARAFWWLVAWALVYGVIYTWLGTVSFPWYFVPPLTVVSLIMAMGLGYLLGDGGADAVRPDSDSNRPAVSRLMTVLGAILLLAIWINRTDLIRASMGNRGYRAAYI